VWLFLLAPAALVCGVGFVSLLSRWTPSLGARAASAWGAVVVAVVLGGVVWRSNEVLVSGRETGTLRDAEAITETFRGVLTPGDRIIAPIPSNAPLQYYFIRAGLDTAAFSLPTSMPPNVYLIVNTGEGFTIATRVAHPLMRYFGEGELVARFASAEVYRLIRR
jgi:hypothetical protein